MFVHPTLYNDCYHFESIEINLCETGLSGCQQLCIKTNGSFYCDCLTGYQLLSDNMTCKGCFYICTYVRMYVRTW